MVRHSMVNAGLQKPCSRGWVRSPDLSLRSAHIGASTRQRSSLQDFIQCQDQLRQPCSPMQRRCCSPLRLQCQDPCVSHPPIDL